MNTLYPNIFEALAALPVGAEAIADHLAALGTQGVCGAAAQCAIAEYLAATVDLSADHLVRVSKNSAEIALSAHRIVAPLSRVWFDSPGQESPNVGRSDITEFIENFDRGQYPALIAGSLLEVVA